MIGVFDSGFGGLGVLKACRARLPTQDFLYLGDSARAPYGSREIDSVLDLAEQCVELLFAEGCRVVVVACHTVSCVALRHLQHHYASGGRRVLGVTIPAAEAAVAIGGAVTGFLGTARTVASGTFHTEMRKLDPEAKTKMLAAPLLAPLVEEGLEEHHLARLAVRHYLDNLGPIDTLVLGCTHYPLLRGAFEAEMEPGVALLDPAPVVADKLADWLSRHEGFSPAGEGELRVLCTGDPDKFARQGEKFLGEKLPRVEAVCERGGVLTPVEGAAVPLMGQIVRAGKK